GGARDPSSGDRLSRAANRVADPANLHPPSLGSKGEHAVGGPNVSVPRNTGRGDICDQHATQMPAIGEMEVAKGTGGGLEILKVMAHHRVVQRGLERIFEIAWIRVANVEVLPAARRIANRERQLAEFAHVRLPQLISRPQKEVHLPVHAVPVPS